MNDANTTILYERYPRLYRDRILNTYESSMCWGFACGDGWFDLIDRLSASLETECERLKVEEGWAEENLPVASQVKAKLGSLRFYLRQQNGQWLYPSVQIEGLIEAARLESAHTCESCGCRVVPQSEHPSPETLCGNCRKTAAWGSEK